MKVRQTFHQAHACWYLVVSMDTKATEWPAHAYYHQTHKKGKWCWLPSEMEELKQQKATGETWNQMSMVSYLYL